MTLNYLKNNLNKYITSVFLILCLFLGGVNGFAQSVKRVDFGDAVANAYIDKNGQFQGLTDCYLKDGGWLGVNRSASIGTSNCEGVFPLNGSNMLSVGDKVNPDDISLTTLNQGTYKEITSGGVKYNVYELKNASGSYTFLQKAGGGPALPVTGAATAQILKDGTDTASIKSFLDTNSAYLSGKNGVEKLSNNISQADNDALQKLQTTANTLATATGDPKLKCTAKFDQDGKATVLQCTSDGKPKVVIQDSSGNYKVQDLPANCNSQGLFLTNPDGSFKSCLNQADADKAETAAKNTAISNTTASDPSSNSAADLFKFVFEFVGYVLIVILYFFGWVATLLLWLLFILVSYLLSINPFSFPWYPLILKLWGFFFGIAVLAILGSLMYSGFQRFLNFTGKNKPPSLADTLTPIVVVLMTINFTFFGIISAYGIAQGIGKVVMYSTATQLNCGGTNDFTQGDDKAYLAIFKCVGNTIGKVSAVRPDLDLSSNSLDVGKSLSGISSCVDEGKGCGNDIVNKIGDKSGRVIAILFAEVMFFLVILAMIWNFIEFAFKIVARIIRLSALTATSPLIVTGYFGPDNFKPLKEFGQKSVAELGSHLVFFPYVSIWVACLGILAKTLTETLSSGIADASGKGAFDQTLGGSLNAFAQSSGGGDIAGTLGLIVIVPAFLIGFMMFLNQSTTQSAMNFGTKAVGGLFKSAGMLTAGAALAPIGLAGVGAGALASKGLSKVGAKMAGTARVGAMMDGVSAGAKKVGMGGGALAGAALGTALLPGIGTVIGGGLGAMSGLGAGSKLKGRVSGLREKLATKYGSGNTASTENQNTQNNSEASQSQGGEAKGSSEETKNVPSPTTDIVNRQLSLARKNGTNKADRARSEALNAVSNIENGDIALLASSLISLMTPNIKSNFETSKNIETIVREFSRGSFSLKSAGNVNLAKDSLKAISEIANTKKGATDLVGQAPDTAKAILQSAKNGSISISPTSATNLANALVKAGVIKKEEGNGYLGAITQQMKGLMGGRNSITGAEIKPANNIKPSNIAKRGTASATSDSNDKNTGNRGNNTTQTQPVQSVNTNAKVKAVQPIPKVPADGKPEVVARANTYKSAVETPVMRKDDQGSSFKRQTIDIDSNPVEISNESLQKVTTAMISGSNQQKFTQPSSLAPSYANTYQQPQQQPQTIQIDTKPIAQSMVEAVQDMTTKAMGASSYTPTGQSSTPAQTFVNTNYNSSITKNSDARTFTTNPTNNTSTTTVNPTTNTTNVSQSLPNTGAYANTAGYTPTNAQPVRIDLPIIKQPYNSIKSTGNTPMGTPKIQNTPTESKSPIS